MKKNFLYAMMSAIALTGAVCVSSCSSSEDVADNPDFNSVDNVVKTRFTIALPSKVGQTRMSATEVQDGGNFRGMDQMVLIPFAKNGVIVSTDPRLAANIVLPNTPVNNSLSSITTTGNAHVYENVTVPVGTYSFLFYGKAIDNAAGDDIADITTNADRDAAMHQYGYLVPAGLEDLKDASNNVTTPANFSFSPKQIYTATTADSKATSIVTYLNSIASVSGWGATTNTNAGLKQLYENFISNKAGSSTSVKLMVQDLYNSVRNNLDDLSVAIASAITNDTYVSNVGTDGALTFKDNISGYPTNIYLPDGAAAVKWDNGAFVVDAPLATNTGVNTTALGSYVYPASLYYRVNSRIKTSNNSEKEHYENGKSWEEILGEYANDNASVQPSTRSIAIKDQIQYAVGRLDLQVRAAAATLKDRYGDAVTVPDGGFPVTAVIIGGQRVVDFEFEPVADGTTTAPIYTIYDNALSGITAAPGTGTTYSETNHTLALQSRKGETVNIAVEFTNTAGDFYGKDGVIKSGSKFYLVAELVPSAGTGYSETTFGKDRVFAQDFITAVKLTINANSSATDQNPGDDGLGNAYNVIPDLRTPQLELGFSVDLTWETGLKFEMDFK